MQLTSRVAAVMDGYAGAPVEVCHACRRRKREGLAVTRHDLQLRQGTMGNSLHLSRSSLAHPAN